MPELPDLTIYVEQLACRLVGQPLVRIRLTSPFLLRSVVPTLDRAYGRSITAVHRLGKRIVLALEGDLFLLLHLMIAGRLHWKPVGTLPPRKPGLATFNFPHGSLLLTESGSKQRASLYLMEGRAALEAFDAGGIEPLAVDAATFRAALSRENRTLKRALTDPSILSGIGNAYSDEILHQARLSPVMLTRRLTDEQHARLFETTQVVLTEWIERLRTETGDGFPEKVTAFRDGMAVHGRYRQPCPACGCAVQRIVHGDHETNYCPRCQTDGVVLADRALSRLLREDWPKRMEELERIQPSSLTTHSTRRGRRPQSYGHRR